MPEIENEQELIKEQNLIELRKAEYKQIEIQKLNQVNETINNIILEIDSDLIKYADEKIKTIDEHLKYCGVRIETQPGKESVGQMLVRIREEIEKNKENYSIKEREKFEQKILTIQSEITNVNNS